VRVNLGCGPHYAAGWTNLDVIRLGEIQPDIIVEPMGPWPFEDGTVDQFYAGHVLEHIPWGDVPVLMAEVCRVLRPGGQFLSVGPDVFRMVRGFGVDHWLTRMGLEDDISYQTEGDSWDGARHKWNAYEDRIGRVLDDAGLTDVTAIPMDELLAFGDWPVLSDVGWQCAVVGTK